MPKLWKISSLFVVFALVLSFSAFITTPAEGTAINSCPWTKRYFMYVYQDVNQPENWQPYCYIISNMTDTPSAADVSRICTPAGSDYTFSVTNTVYKGWLYTDCHGGHHFGWPDWQSDWFSEEFARPWTPQYYTPFNHEDVKIGVR
jgi:hypothetical protein